MAVLKAKELRDLTEDELRIQLEEKTAALRALRFQMITGSVENVRAMRNTRREIARIKTVIRGREIAAHKKAQ